MLYMFDIFLRKKNKIVPLLDQTKLMKQSQHIFATEIVYATKYNKNQPYRLTVGDPYWPYVHNYNSIYRPEPPVPTRVNL